MDDIYMYMEIFWYMFSRSSFLNIFIKFSFWGYFFINLNVKELKNLILDLFCDLFSYKIKLWFRVKVNVLLSN